MKLNSEKNFGSSAVVVDNTGPVQAARFKSDFRDKQWTIPALFILLVEIGLFVWMAPRGYDFTDEAFYFNNFLYWREFTGTVTFFGAYFEWPFRAMGQSIGGIRILSLLLVLSSAAFLMHQVFRFAIAEQGELSSERGRITGWYLVAPTASAMMFFSYFSSIRAPSYNLLSLFTMVIATACMLNTINSREGNFWKRNSAFIYGIAVGACFLSKATTAALMILMHLVFFVSLNRFWSPKYLTVLLSKILAGIALNFIVLTILFPKWFGLLREGLEILRIRGGYSSGDMLYDLRWEVQHVLTRCAPWFVGLCALFLILRNRLRRAPNWLISVLAVMSVGASTLMLASAHRTKFWIFSMGATVCILWALDIAKRTQMRFEHRDRLDLALVTLFFLLPLGFSFGTNLSVLGHSIIASVFVFCMIFLRLYRLSIQGVLSGRALALCVALLCVPGLAVQLYAFTDLNPFRRLGPITDQKIPATLATGGSVVLVDDHTNRMLQNILVLKKDTGFEAGNGIIDFTGDSPGIIYAMGGIPVGTPWMIGGHAGSSPAAQRILEKVSPELIRNSWLLTSTDNPRRIEEWKGILASRIGSGSHELMTSIEIDNHNPRWWDPHAPQKFNIQLWRPAGLLSVQSGGTPDQTRR